MERHQVIWGSGWDDLLAKDTEGALVNVMNTVDGSTSDTRPRTRCREHFFGKDTRA